MLLCFAQKIRNVVDLYVWKDETHQAYLFGQKLSDLASALWKIMNA